VCIFNYVEKRARHEQLNWLGTDVANNMFSLNDVDAQGNARIRWTNGRSKLQSFVTR
jgi:hypothetical protein